MKIKEKIEKGEKFEEKEFGFLSSKERIIVLNTDGTKNFLRWIKDFDEEIYPCPFKIYQEMEDIEEKKDVEEVFKKEGNYSPQDILWEAFKKLGFIIFYTVKNQILSAFVIKMGTKAIEAAEKVHSDIKKGFIKVEVANLNDFLKFPFWNLLKEKGLLRAEGKDYIVKDREILEFKFSS